MAETLTVATVESVLTRSPRAAKVFLDHGMACVGCTMAPFDTVADAADAYGLDAHRLAAELAGTIRPAPDGFGGSGEQPTDEPATTLEDTP
jgi:hybrid cluster-associated redox disulfide protein